MTKAKLSAYALIIKANGMPRIDKPIDVPQNSWDTLTLKQQIYANDQVVGVLRKSLKLGVYHGRNTPSRSP
jgi:hypothetical protein